MRLPCSVYLRSVWKLARQLLCCALATVVLEAGFAKTPPGSVYVPLDSWVYAALDRLAGLGTIDTQFAGLRPWTRVQCAIYSREADDNLTRSETKNPDVQTLVTSLKQEFRQELNALSGDPAEHAEVESVYSRAMGISGEPLRDAFFFGQTVANDFGRPFNTGFNNVTGIAARASSGRFFAYVRGEYQHSPTYAGLTPTQNAYIQLTDGAPTAPNSRATGTIDQFELLDTYVGMRLSVFEVTAGKQSDWWGPGTMGGMLYSNNIDPVPMVNVNQVQPVVLPWLLKYLGPVRIEGLFGRLEGYHYPRAPYIHGEKIMVKPSRNLEIGVSRSTVAFGQGIPFTLRNLISTYFSTSDVCCVANPRDFPGKRFAGLDFAYRLPYLRDRVTLYTDNITSDDVSPVVNPSRASYNPGIYFSQIPLLSKLDLRFEVANTRTKGGPYSSFFYHEGYTNKGFLIGNTVGQHGSAFDLSSTFWFSARQRIQVGWRKETVSKSFLPDGGSQDSIRLKATWLVQQHFEFSALAQHERWVFPFLTPLPQNDNVFSLQVTAYPSRHWSRTALRNPN